MTVAEPVITPSGENLYQRAGSVMVYDEQQEWTGRYLSQALMGMFQELDQIVMDTPSHPGWCTIVDPTVCPPIWLSWCAQLYGVTLPLNISTTEKRRIIEDLPPQSRGSIGAMRLAAEATLTGAKEVTLTEQAEGHAYRIVASTIPSQTPHVTATREALLSQKPGGIKLVYEAAEGPKWSQATKKWHEVGPTVTWGTVETGQV